MSAPWPLGSVLRLLLDHIVLQFVLCDGNLESCWEFSFPRLLLTAKLCNCKGLALKFALKSYFNM